MNRSLIILATLALVTGLFGTAALAHADLVSSTPAAGTTVAVAPATVVLTFSEDITTGTTAKVTDANGATVSIAATIDTAVRTKLTVTLKSGLGSGRYTVTWHSIAADDNGVKDGSFSFGVGVPVPSTTTETQRNEPLALVLLAVAALLGLISLRALRSGKARA